MRVVVIKNNLKEGLDAIQRASGESLNLPILKYALLEVMDQNIKLTATNLEIAISCLVLSKAIDRGRVCIPISTFLGLINNLGSERINLERKGNQLALKTDNYEAIIQTLSVDDFPIIPKIKNEREFFEIKSEVFKEALLQTLSASQFSELRPELNSVLFDFSLDTLKLVTTDSFRLAEKTITPNQFKTNHGQNFKLLIPLKTAQELLRILKDDEVLRIYHDQNQVLFKTERLEFISRLVDGNFPDYTAIIPKGFDSEVILEREKIMSALKLVGVFSGRSGEVKLKAPNGEKVLEIYSSSQETGENKYLLPAKATKKLEEVTFNWRYLADGLKALQTDQVFLGLNEEDKKPTIIKSPNEASFFYIVMPILKT